MLLEIACYNCDATIRQDVEVGGYSLENILNGYGWTQSSGYYQCPNCKNNYMNRRVFL